MVRFGLSAIAVTLALGHGAPVLAQSYPVRPIRVVVGFAPGGAPDLLARQLSEPLTTRLGQTVVVDNRPGANGVIGADIVSKASPDGYTVLITSASFAVNPSIYRKLPYDPIRDFTPITNAATGGGLILCVSPQFPAKSVKELIALARKPGSRLSYASAGAGNTTHLAGALFAARAGIDMVHVPYKAGGPALAALMGGEVQVYFGTPISSVGFIKAGKIRALAYNFSKRLDALPDLPTLEEAGVPGTKMDGSWYGVFAPPKTPQAVVQLLQQEIRTAVMTPAMRERMAPLGLEPDGRSPAEFKTFVEESIARFRELVKLAGVEPQ